LDSLNLAVEDSVLGMVIHLEKQVGLLYGVHTICSTGDSISLLVTNDERGFQI